MAPDLRKEIHMKKGVVLVPTQNRKKIMNRKFTKEYVKTNKKVIEKMPIAHY